MRVLLALLTLAFALGPASIVRASNAMTVGEVRIPLAADIDSAVVRGAVTRTYTRSYFVYARAGQTLTVHLLRSNDNGSFRVHGPDDQSPLFQSSPGDERQMFQAALTKDGDYQISLRRGPIGEVTGYDYVLHVAVTGTPLTPADTLTAVTLNLWHDAHDWPKRLPVILAGLRSVKPDVVCLQEVLQHEKLRNQAETLADSLGFHLRFASVDGPERPKRYGNAVLTPHNVLASGERNLDPADDYRAVAHLRFAWRGREIDAYSTHLHHTPQGGPIRTKQIRHLLAWVDSTKGKGPVVLAGDFNAELGTPEMDLVTSRYVSAFRSVHPGARRAEAVTFNSRFGADPGQIDHVFVPARGAGAMTPIASEVMFRSVGPDSVWASDHFGVMARLRAGR